MLRVHRIIFSLVCLFLLVCAGLFVAAQTSMEEANSILTERRLIASAMTSGPFYSKALSEAGRGGINPFIRVAVPEDDGFSPNQPFKDAPDGVVAYDPPGVLLATASYTTGISTGDDLDVETSMVVVNRVAGGTPKDHSVFGYIKYHDSIFQNYATTYKTGDAQYTRQAMELPEDYDMAVDPVLTANALSSGVEPKRVYYFGLLAQDDSLEAPSAISVQWSDDGGFNWDDLVEIDRSDTAGIYLDKPDATVSPYSGTRGYLYVCYTELELDPYDPYGAEIRVTRSEDGGETWETPVTVVEGDVSACQISHSLYYNRVYLAWSNWDDDTIDYATSDNKGVSWSAVETAADAWLKGPYNREMDFIHGGAMTVSQMRFDWVNNQVELVWHECEYGDAGTHTGANNSLGLVDANADFIALGVQVGDYVRNLTEDSFAFVSAVTSSTELGLTDWKTWVGGERRFDNGDEYIIKAKNTNVFFVRKTGNGWQSKVRLDVPLENDQFMPSIDFSSSSDRLVIGYLDRSDDTATPNRDYVAAWIETDASGAEEDSGLVDSYFYSNPVGNGFGLPGTGWLGDYTDTFFWPFTDGLGDPLWSRWHFVFPGKAASEWNVFASAIE